MNPGKYIRLKRSIAYLLCIVLVSTVAVPVFIRAQSRRKTVRVGWYESSFNITDSSGRRSGYAYEYQVKLSAYTGWNYEYVSGSWSELLTMLEKGEIDLLSDVSFTKERTQKMLFPSLPMGTEEYYLFISPDNQEISSTKYSTLTGKKVGVNKGSIQKGLYDTWAKANKIRSEIVELTCSEDESLRMLENGSLDAYVTVDSFSNPTQAIPLIKIGSSDFFFAVNKNRPDLLSDLNYGMNKIQDENRYYNQQMFEKYFTKAGANAFLSTEEANWLSAHGPIRVGYQDNFMAFCAKDKITGEMTGLLKDYLDYASDCMSNVHIDFETKAYPTSDAAITALERGELDCIFPCNLNSYDSESLGIVITPPMVNTEIYAVTRTNDQKVIASKKNVIVAVNEGNPNYNSFLRDNYPDWKIVYFPTSEDCLKAISDEVADCILLSTYRLNNMSSLCDKYNLTTISTGLGLDYCFAIDTGETELYTIMAKTMSQVPDSTINRALSYYITEDAKVTLSDFVIENLVVVLGLFILILMIIVSLMLKSMRSEKKAKDLISATEIDKLTGLYNRDFFFQYADRMFRSHPNTSMDAIVLNIEQFHSVNALHGREFGDQVLRVLGEEIKNIAKTEKGIGGRYGADRFDIYIRHTDKYENIFRQLQNKLDDLASNTSIRLRMGVMPWQHGLEPVTQFDRAHTACSMARGHYKEHLIVFDDNVHRQELYNQRLINDLRRALERYEFEIYFQPKFNIQTEPPTLVSAEALVRWQHPELGLIPPNDFIPLFEKNGQIGLIDTYVWEEVARKIVFWQEAYGVTLPVSVNVSRVDLFDPALEETLDRILRFNGLAHECLRLEMTESAYTENAEHVIKVVENLRKKGYYIEMDDFGTGYSSLNMLSTMPIDVLKMDRIFIKNIEHDERNIQLVALILGIAKNLSIPVVAEGVETKEQLELLKNLGCEVVQGYYFSYPLHPTEFESEYIQNLSTQDS